MSERSEIDQIQKMIDARNARVKNTASGRPYLRPKNAATLVILDGKKGSHTVLMGVRNRTLKFMPGALVFPGGRVDRADHSIECADGLSPLIAEKLSTNTRSSKSANTPRALGIAAVRELYEETGLMIGEQSNKLSKHPDWRAFTEKNIAPAIGSLRLLGRAITPPGNLRRFDTWFFVTRADRIVHSPETGPSPCGELEALQWLSPEDAIRSNTMNITKILLTELINRLKSDPQLRVKTEIPFYRTSYNRFVRELI